LARLLGDLLGRDAEAVELRVDSKSTLALAKNPVFHERSKYICIKYHFIRSCWDEGNIKAGYINTQDQTFTPSPLGRSSSRSFASGLGWFKFPRRRHTGLRGRITAISLVLYPQPAIVVVRLMKLKL
jgi:hypothetical protein